MSRPNHVGYYRSERDKLGEVYVSLTSVTARRNLRGVSIDSGFTREAAAHIEESIALLSAAEQGKSFNAYVLELAEMSTK